jgi:hypothetical protein
MVWAAAIPAIAGLAGGLLGSKTPRAAQYRPWSTDLGGLGAANFANGRLSINPDAQQQMFQQQLYGMGQGSLERFGLGQQNMLGPAFLRSEFGTANQGQYGGLLGLQQAAGQQSQYGPMDFMSGVNNGMLNNFDPNQASANYTNLLRQQAQPQEQQAASSALTNLFNTGRLGSTGGMQAYQTLMDSQNQADLGRQVAGQQFGLQQQLQAQQGYDQARQNQQGLMLNQFGANQQGMMNQFGMDQGMFGRQLDLYTNSNSATQDRFMRALQMFGGEGAQNQQDLGNFMQFLGAGQSQNQQLMDLARIGASVGTAQNSQNANAALMANQQRADLFSGFLGALGNMNTGSRQPANSYAFGRDI